MIVEASDEVEECFALAFGTVGEFGLLDEVLLEGGAEYEGIEKVLTARLVFAAVALAAVFFGKLLTDVFIEAIEGREILGVEVEFVAFAAAVVVFVLAQVLNANAVEGQFLEEGIVLKFFEDGGA